MENKQKVSQQFSWLRLCKPSSSLSLAFFCLLLLLLLPFLHSATVKIALSITLTQGDMSAGTGATPLERADNICQNDADASLVSGEWRALLACNACGSGGSSVSFTDRLQLISALGDNIYENMKSGKLANNRADLLDSTLYSPIKYRIDGTLPPGLGSGKYPGIAWTGANSDGTPIGLDDCQEWASSNGIQSGMGGYASSTVKAFNVGTGTCNFTPALYCFSVSGTGNGDPHFVGFDGSKYNFDGEGDKVFSIYSARGLNLNSMFRMKNVRGVLGTWMTEFGIKTRDVQIIFNPSIGVTVIILRNNNNGKKQELILRNGNHQINNSTSIIIENNKDNEMISSLQIKNEFAELSFKVNRFGSELDDFYVDLQISLLQSPINPHGVLGQSAKHVGSSSSASFSLEGEMKDYIVSDGLLGDDFTFNNFDSQIQEQEQQGEEKGNFTPLIAHFITRP